MEITTTQTTNSIVSTSVETYVTEFKNYMTKTAETFLETARIVNSAKCKLNPTEFSEFCKKIGMNSKSPTISKFISIGARYELLNQHKNCLPSKWTSLYEISRASEPELEQLFNEKRISPMMKGSDIKEALGITNQPKSKTEKPNEFSNRNEEPKYSFSCLIEETPTSEEVEKISQLIKQIKDMGISITLSDELATITD